MMAGLNSLLELVTMATEVGWMVPWQHLFSRGCTFYLTRGASVPSCCFTGCHVHASCHKVFVLFCFACLFIFTVMSWGWKSRLFQTEVSNVIEAAFCQPAWFIVAHKDAKSIMHINNKWLSTLATGQYQIKIKQSIKTSYGHEEFLTEHAIV